MFGKATFAREGDASSGTSARAAAGGDPPTPSLREVLESFDTMHRRLEVLVPPPFDGKGMRAGAWTIPQVIHHLADVHAAGLYRVRRALTEECPRFDPYDHERWAELPDAREAALVPESLALLRALHRRWVALLERVEPYFLRRTYKIRGRRRPVTIEEDLLWHLEHMRQHLEALERIADGADAPITDSGPGV